MALVAGDRPGLGEVTATIGAGGGLLDKSEKAA